jgi:hypothetical protein
MGPEEMSMRHLKQISPGFISVFVIIVVFTVVLMPSFNMVVDRLRRLHDADTALMMTETLKDFTPTTNPDASMVRKHVSNNLKNFKTFTPLTDHSGFFYLEDQNVIIHLNYADALDADDDGDDHSVGFASPSELFAPGMHLLTESGNLVADVVSYIYSRALPQTYLQDYGIRIREEIDTAQDVLSKRLSTSTDNSGVVSLLHQLLDHYHPSQTLYVGNTAWQTTAVMGSDIRTVVFLPGIQSVPSFINRGYASYSIAIDRLMLPATITQIGNNAFGLPFRITELVFTRTLDTVPAAHAFDGVHAIVGLNDIFYRDNNRFRIEDTLNTMPLVTFVINDIDKTVLFDLSVMFQYFQSRSITITDHIIHYDAHDQVLSKVYLYTADGYYGYIVPVRR